MKKTLVKITVFTLTFLVSLVVISRIMNQGNDNMTMEIAPASFPVITMETIVPIQSSDSADSAGNGEDGGALAEIGMSEVTEKIAYNQLHGYRNVMDPAFQRETITQLGESREVAFTVDTYGITVNAVSIEVRSQDGERLVENSQVTDLAVGEENEGSVPGTGGVQLHGSIALKDLLEENKEYMLVILLDTEEEGVIRYYTRILWNKSANAAQKLQFASEFHELLYDRDEARERKVTKYLESNSTGDNTTFHKVNIHSSFSQITWGDLNVTEVTEPVIQMTELGSQTGTMVLHYIVSTTQEKTDTYYMVEEMYRVRFPENADRMYLLDYERTMTQIPDVEGDIYANDKILLGIVDENLPFVESADGNIVVFQAAGRLCSYHVSTNQMTVLFGCYDRKNADDRTLYGKYDMKILDVDEGGNVRFAVYGYMNRGRHEGEVGIQVYYYDHALNTIEEAVYIPSQKSYDVLAEEMEQLLFLSREDKLYFYLDNTVFYVNIPDMTCEELVTITQDGTMMASGDGKVLVWQEGEANYRGTSLVVKNLSNGLQSRIAAKTGTYIRLLGFLGEDIIYGLARVEDVTVDSAGKVFFPMYQICISNCAGELLKETGQENIYVTQCSVSEGQVTLERVQRMENGGYQETANDYIMSNEEATVGKNKLFVANIDVYEKYVQIQTRAPVNEKSLQVRSPKEVVFEGGRQLKPNAQEAVERYYAYDAYGICGIYLEAADAVKMAYESYGVVTDDEGRRIWSRGNLVTRNQIMAIKGIASDENRSTLAVCLDTMLQKEGITINTQAFLDQGQSVQEILSEGLNGCKILDLTGVSLDTVLYYVNQDIPVLALLDDGEAVLITGFNEFNVVIMDPETGSLEKKGIKDSAEWFAQNGNCFITYVYQ